MNKFKIGDKVRITEKAFKTGYGCSICRNEELKEGHILEVIKVGGGNLFVKGNKGTEYISSDKVELVKKGKIPKPKKLTHAIIYDIEGCDDPTVLCYSKEEMKEEVKKILLKKNTIQESIRVFEVKELRQPKLSIRF